MLNDFEPIIHKFDSDITIIPISDVHLGAIEHNKDEWNKFVKWIENEENTYLTLGGDLVNNGVRSSIGNPFDEIYRPSQQKKIMVEYLKPIKDKILCSTSGNHEARTRKESDMELSYDIMSKLDIEDLYRENACFMFISLGTRKYDNTPEVTYNICVTHGSGGGIYTGASVNRSERFLNVINNCDCLITGHTHKGSVTRPSSIYMDGKNKKVSMRSTLSVVSVSWMNFAGYAMRKMLLPSETSVPQKLRLVKAQNNKRIEVTW